MEVYPRQLIQPYPRATYISSLISSSNLLKKSVQTSVMGNFPYGSHNQLRFESRIYESFRKPGISFQQNISLFLSVTGWANHFDLNTKHQLFPRVISGAMDWQPSHCLTTGVGSIQKLRDQPHKEVVHIVPGMPGRRQQAVYGT